MNLLHLNQRESRAPETEVLPDGRKRLTRYFEAEGLLKIPPELNLAYGTVDTGAGPSGWTGLRLTNKKLTDELAPKGKDSRPVIVLVFEQIDASAETAVGGTPQSFTEDGRGNVIFDYIQFSSANATPGTIGTSTAPGFSGYYLKTEDVTDDGTLRTIKRTYVNAGIIATDLQTKNGGALLIQTITSVKTVPSTPGGYTLIGQPTQNPLGLPIYTYTYAKGNGEISREIRYGQSSDQGATAGSTTTIIRYLTDVSVSSDPTTPPSGAVNIGVERENQDGYRIWTSTYAKGVGIVVNDTQTKNGGKLVLYHVVALGGAPSTPAATIGGTVTLTGASDRKAEGYDIFDYTWAEGNGEISRQIEYRMSPDQGTTGMTVTTIRFLTPTSTGSDPTTAPSGAQNITFSHEDVDGYRIWTSIYAKGVGIVSSDVEKRNTNKLIVYSITSMGTAPSAPSPTIGGTVIATKTSQRNGNRTEDGTIVYDYQWVEGVGLISQVITDRVDGLREQTYVALGTKQTPAGVVTRDEQEEEDGVTRYTVTCMQKSDGSSPTSGSITVERMVPATYPGRAKAYTKTAADGWVIVQVFLEPPTETDIKAAVNTTYQTTGSLSGLGTLWQPKANCVIEAEWTALNNTRRTRIEGLRGYRSISSAPLSVSVPVLSGLPGGSMLGDVIFGGTTAIVTVYDGYPQFDDGTNWVLEARVEPAFTDVAGTQYYRQVVIQATAPTQPVLPV